MYTAELSSAKETERIAAQLAVRLTEAFKSEAPGTIFVGLVGPMGAGKTTFVRGFVEALAGGLEVEISSPTYAIAQPYSTQPDVLHVDLFRLESADDLEAIGGAQLLTAEGFVLVEWLDRLGGVEASAGDAASVASWTGLKDWVEVRLTPLSQDCRQIRVLPHGSRAAAWLQGAFSP